MSHSAPNFGHGNSLPTGAASHAERRGFSPRSGSPRDLARRACDYIEAAVCGLAEALFGLWGLDAEEDGVERIAGGRTEARVIALLGAVIDATQDVAFRLRGIRFRAREALALDDLDAPHRAIYALGRFDETETGQLALPYTNQRPIAA